MGTGWIGRIAALALVGALSAAPPQGPIPPPLPGRLLVGFIEEEGETWMARSGVRWDLRARVLHKGWVEDGLGRTDGHPALQFMRESEEQGSVPLLAFSQLAGEP